MNNIVFTVENMIETTGLNLPENAECTLIRNEDACDITSNFIIEKKDGFVIEHLFEYRGVQCASYSKTYAATENFENTDTPAIYMLIEGQVLLNHKIDTYLKFNNEKLEKSLQLNEKQLEIYMRWKGIKISEIASTQVIVDFCYTTKNELKLETVKSNIIIRIKNEENIDVSRELDHELYSNKLEKINIDTDIDETVRKLHDIATLKEMITY